MRLDNYLSEKTLVSSRSKAKDLIERGFVSVNDIIVRKSGFKVTDTDHIKVSEKLTYVSRAGEKLKDAIDYFKIDLKDLIIIDVGSSTGGFTDCSLREGAKFVYAYDVGNDQMDKILREDKRIELHENTNFLDIIVPPSDYILIDVSFTSVIPFIRHVKSHENYGLILIKPQFEAGKINFKGGILKDKKKHHEIITNIIEEAENFGFRIIGLKKSDIKGKSGNQEYMLYFKKDKGNYKFDRKKLEEII